MKALLGLSAWPMEKPVLYGTFHLAAVITGVLFALILAFLLKKISSRKMQNRILFICGLILIAGEIYKQLFYFFYMNDGQYYWWIFPFQLCSLPMYLLPVIPFIKSGKVRRIICTFLLDFGIMGAVATFIDPSGLFHSYLTLTLHGFLWHDLLLFAGLFILVTGQADLSPKGFLAILPPFGAACILAEIFNTAFHSKGEINMFYISPYEMSNQLVFGDIDKAIGRIPGIFIYILVMILAAGLIHLLSWLFDRYILKNKYCQEKT